MPIYKKDPPQWWEKYKKQYESSVVSNSEEKDNIQSSTKPWYSGNMSPLSEQQKSSVNNVMSTKKDIPDWQKDIQKHGIPKDGDFSNYSSFNTAFRTAREYGLKNFMYNNKNFNTNLIDKKESDEYFKEKKWLIDYYQNLEQLPLRNPTGVYVDYFNDYIISRNNPNQIDSSDFKNYVLQRYKKQHIDAITKPTYFSISKSFGKDANYYGRYARNSGKLEVSPEPYNYIHELTHKSNDIDDFIYGPNEISIDTVNKYRDSYRDIFPDQRSFEYFSDPYEILARKMSTLYWLDQNNRPWKNLKPQDIDSLYNLTNVPNPTRQLLDSYLFQKDDLLKTLNR